MVTLKLEDATDEVRQLFEAALSGEEVRIVSDDDAVRLVPESKKPRLQYGAAKDQVWLADDWDEPLEDFKEYME